jgi:molybdenum cofactor synthesis domain-containing protein
MDVAILTVGDAVLAGATENTNATWLARQVTDRGATVRRVLVVPDDRGVIADAVADWADRFDATLVTGGLGGTPDDVTAAAVADALDCDLTVDPGVRATVRETAAAYREANPDLAAAHDLDLDIDAWAALPAGSRPLDNPEGLCPGFARDGVYAFPGVPAEMKATFGVVADEFGGDVVSRTFHTPQPEGSMVEVLVDARERFDVTVGSYPSTDGPNLLQVTGTDEERVAAATAWLRDRVETCDENQA